MRDIINIQKNKKKMESIKNMNSSLIDLKNIDTLIDKEVERIKQSDYIKYLKDPKIIEGLQSPEVINDPKHGLWNTAKEIIKESKKVEAISLYNNVSKVIDPKIDSVIELTKNSNVFESYKDNKASEYKPLKKETRNNLKEVFEFLAEQKKQFDKKENTAMDLQKQTIELNNRYSKLNLKGSINDMISATKNFYNADHIIVFDSETIGGTNIHNVSTIDTMVEYSYDIYERLDDGTFGTNEAGNIKKKSVNRVIGIPQHQKKMYEEMIENIKKRGIKTSEEKILANTLLKYSNAEISDDFRVIKNSHTEISNYDMIDTVKLKEGLNKLLDINKKQLVSNDIPLYEKELIDFIVASDKSFKGGNIQNVNLKSNTAIVTKNGTASDFPWINSLLQNGMLSEKGQKELAQRLGRNYLSVDSSRHLDLEDVITTYTYTEGKKGLYAPGAKELKEGTHAAQETLGKHWFANLFEDDEIAHIAQKDTEVLFNLVTQTTTNKDILQSHGEGTVFLDYINSKIFNSDKTDLSDKTKEKIMLQENIDLSNFKNLVLYADSYIPMNEMGYVIDPISGEIRTSGKLKVTKDDVQTQLIQEPGIQKGGTYSIKGISELNLSKEQINAIKEAYPLLGHEKLFQVSIGNVFDEAIEGADSRLGFKTDYNYIFNSEESLKSFLNKFLVLGEQAEDGSIKPMVDSKIFREMFSTFELQDGQVIKTNNISTPEDVVTSATKYRINEPAARYTREKSFRRNNKFYEFVDTMKEHLKEQGIEEPSSQKIKEYTMDIARKISSNETITLDDQSAFVVENARKILGFKNDYKQQELFRQTLDNYLSSYDYLDSMRGLHEKILSTNKDITESQYEYILNNVLADLSSDTNEFLNSSNNSIYKHNLQYFEIDTSLIGDKTGRVHTASDRNPYIQRIKLNDKNGEYSLMKLAYETITGNDYKSLENLDKTRVEIEKINALKKFKETISETHPIFKKLKHLDINKDSSALEISRAIYEKMQDIATSTDENRIINNITVQDVTTANKVLKNASEEAIENAVKKHSENLPNIRFLNKDIKEDSIKNFVEDFIFTSPKEKIVKDLETAYKNNPTKLEYLMNLYNMSKKDAFEVSKQLIESINNVGGDFFYDTSKDVAGFIKDGKFVELNNLMRINFTGDNFNLELGNTKVTLNSALSIGLRKSGPEIKLTSNIAKAWSNMGFNVKKAIQNADEQDRAINQTLSVVNRFAEKLRESPAITTFNASERLKTFSVDVKDAVKALPLYKDDILDLIDEKEKQEFYRIFKSTFDMDLTTEEGKEAFSKLSYESLMSTPREAISKNYINIIRKVASESGDKNLKKIAANLTAMGSEKDTSEGIFTYGPTNVTGLDYVNSNQRPLVYQNRYIEQSKKQLEKKIVRQKYANEVAIGSLFGSTNTGTTIHRNNNDIVGEVYSVIRANRLNTNTYGYHKLLADNKDKIIDRVNQSFDNDKASNIILDKLFNANIWNDAAIIDGRLASVAIGRTEYQKINVRKKLYTDFKQLNDFIKSMNDYSKEILPFVKLNPDTGQVEDITLKQGKRVKRYDKLLSTLGYNDTENEYFAKRQGVFSFGYFAKEGNILLDKDDILEELKKKRFNTEEEVFDYLNKTFDANYYVRTMFGQGYNKFLIGGSEKMEASTLEFGFGDLNEDFVKASKENDNVKDFLNKIVSNDDDIEYLAKQLKKTSIFENKDIDEIIDEIRKEKFIASDILFDDILEGKVSMITDTGDFKHKNAGHALEGLLGSIQKDLELTPEEFAEELNKRKIFKDGVSVIDDYIVPNVYHGGIDIDGKTLSGAIDYNAIEELLKDNDLLDEYDLSDSNDIKSYGKSYNLNGQRIGVMSDVSIAAFDEHEGNTGRYYTDIRRLNSEINTINKSINDLMDIDDIDETERLAKIKELKAEKRTLTRELNKQQRAVDTIDKGMKIGARELEMLKLNTFDKTTEYALNNSALKDVFDLESYDDFINIDNNNNNNNITVKEEKKGSYILSQQISKLTNSILNGGSTRRQKVDQAKRLKSIKLGEKALRFNLNKDVADNLDENIKTLENNGFKKVDIQDILTAIPDAKDQMESMENNIFKDSYIIDLGEDFEDSKRYIAAPKLPIKELNNSYVSSNAQKELAALKASYNSYLDIKSGNAEGNLEKQYTNVLRKRQDVIDSYNKDIFGKEGIFSEASSARLERSYLGKADTAVYATVEDSMDDSMKDIVKEIQENSIYQKAQFKGKSLAELYDKGIYLDATFASQEVFDSLGYFKEDYMKSVLGDNGLSYDDMKAQMIEKLETEGTMALTGRPPTTYEGSIKPTMLYLDNNLKAGHIAQSVVTQLSANADNDGDNSIISIIEDKEGRDYLQASKQTNNKNFKESEMLMMQRAVTTNRVYHKTFMKDYVNGLKEGNFDLADKGLIENYAINGTIYSEFNVRPDLESIREQKSLADELFSNSELDVKSLGNKEYGEEIDRLVSNITDEAEATKYRNAAIFSRLIGETELTEVTKAKKKSIGEVNIPLWKLRAMSSISQSPDLDLTFKNRRVIQSAAQIIEQDIISAKKASATEMFTKIDEFRSAMNSFGSNEGLAMKKWMDKYKDGLMGKLEEQGAILASQGIDNYIDLYDNDFNLVGDKEELFTRFRDDFVKAGYSINTKTVSDTANSIRLGQALNGITLNDIEKMAYSQGNNTIQGELIKRIFKDEATGYSQSELGHKRIFNPEDAFENRQTLKEDLKYTTGRTIQKIAEESKGGGFGILSKAALGIAGAYMLAGYAGGSPVQDATTQANIASNDQQGYSIPMLGDPNSLTMNGNRGYMININTNTEKGAKEVSSIIENVTNNTLPAQVNMRINIQNDQSNINDIYIQNLLAGALQ